MLTPYPDLDGVLETLVAGVEDVLHDNLCGAYLHGSFALGDADVHSDVDFLVVTRASVTDAEESRLRELHAWLPEQEAFWAQHLEGSYVRGDQLRRIDPDRTPWLYVDNGSREMEWSPHDNSAVVRWTLRERGVVLAGPDPTALIDPVTAADLRHEVSAAMDAFPPDPVWWAQGLDNAWAQPFIVATFCRMLYTLEQGVVGSKRAALEWAADTLDGRWADLVRQALDDRPDPWLRVHRPARPGSVAATREFVDYALSERRSP